MVIAIILLGLFLIVFSLSSLIRSGYVDKEPEVKAFGSVLKQSEENMSDVNLIVGEMRRELAETILELQKEIMDIKEKIESQDAQTNIENQEENEVNYLEFVEEAAPQREYNDNDKSLTNNVKINDIERMLKEGYSIDDISEGLQIGKGEILLIKDLYLK